MVDDVELNNAVKQLAAHESEVSVNGGQSALLECPSTLLEVLGITVVVVKVSDSNYKLLENHLDATQSQ